MAAKLIPSARHDLEVLLEYWGNVFINDFTTHYIATFEKGTNYAFDVYAMLGVGIFNAKALRFDGQGAANLEPEPRPAPFINKPIYLHEVIKGLFITDIFNELFEQYKRLLYLSYQARDQILFKQISAKIIGLHLMFMVQEEFSNNPIIEKKEALDKTYFLLDKISRLDISGSHRISKHSSILYTISNVLQFKYTGRKDDYFGYTAAFIDKYNDEFKDKYDQIPEVQSRKLFDLIYKGMRLPSDKIFGDGTYLRDFEEYWPSFKKYIPFHKNGGVSYYSSLGFVRELAQKNGYLRLSDEITNIRMRLLATDVSLTPSSFERLFIKTWGYFTNYGTSFLRLIVTFIFITLFSSFYFSYSLGVEKPLQTYKQVETQSLPNKIDILKTSLKTPSFYSEVLKSTVLASTMKDGIYENNSWVRVVIHVSYFLFYTLFIGQIITFISRYS